MEAEVDVDMAEGDMAEEDLALEVLATAWSVLVSLVLESLLKASVMPLDSVSVLLVVHGPAGLPLARPSQSQQFPSR
jgi:hypothetical protein